MLIKSKGRVRLEWKLLDAVIHFIYRDCCIVLQKTDWTLFFNTVLQHLDYEDGSLKNVTITVENEIPYYSCKVQSRSSSASASASSLWKVSYTGGATGATMTETALSLSTYNMTVIVEDVNDSPVFDEPNKAVKLKENVKAGQWLAKFTAKDPDITSANTVK